MNKLVAALMCSSAVAFAPQSAPKASVVVYADGKYDGKLWDMDAKKDVWGEWDPSSPRSETNFNPFERNPDGNGCDCSGYFPGEGKYKDPERPDMNFAKMMEEKEIMEKINADPKNQLTGKPGNL